MNKVAGMKECVEALATKRGITKVEATKIMNDVLEVIEEKCVQGGVSFKGMFSIKHKVIKGRSGNMNGHKWETDDRTSLKISVSKDLIEKLNK